MHVGSPWPQSEMHERLDGVSDSEQFKVTRLAMDVLGFSAEEQSKVSEGLTD